MRAVAVSLLLLALPAGCADDGACGALTEELDRTFEAMDENPSRENFAASSEANQRWLEAGCDE